MVPRGTHLVLADRILSLFNQDTRMSASDIRKNLGLSDEDRTVTRALQHLKQRRKLYWRGKLWMLRTAQS